MLALEPTRALSARPWTRADPHPVVPLAQGHCRGYQPTPKAVSSDSDTRSYLFGTIMLRSVCLTYIRSDGHFYAVHAVAGMPIRVYLTYLRLDGHDIVYAL